METQYKSIESMRAYLLGLLPDDEAAALEEDYFVDRKSLHRLQTEEAALITDYLDGRLGKKESQLFEGRYLRVPELHRKVETVRHARRALPMQSKRAVWVRWGIAAAAALAFVLGLGLWNRQHLTKRPESVTQAQPVKQESPVPSQPLQDRSVTRAAELERPLIPQIASSKKKSIAGIRQHKNDAVPAARSLEDYLFADSPALRDVAATVASTSPSDRPSQPLVRAQRKRRIAVLDFDYRTVEPYVTSIYGSNQDIGQGITDMLVEALVRGGNYWVIERKAVDKVLTEQNFSDSDRANPAVAVRIGKLLGVDAVIMGSVTKFGRDDKNKSIGGLGVGPRAFGIGGVKRNEAKAVCAISARLVDANTGEILAAVTGEGESRRSGTSLIGGAGSNGGGAGGFDTHASNFGQTLLGEAVTQAVSDVGGQLGPLVGNVPPRKVDVSGIVTDVSGSTLIVNVGSKTGLKVGDKLDISRAVHQIQDPATGKVLNTVTNQIGEGTITEIDTDSATLTFSGNTAAKVGDVAKTPH
jgi:curli biogenesis system outer membrane secretion channel CsgG